MARRNVNYIKPEDPEFLKVLKKQAGYDDQNHKFDKLKNSEEDFVDDEESELPQVVVLKAGDLTAEEADAEKKRLEKEQSEAKADLNKKIVFKAKDKSDKSQDKKRKSDTRFTKDLKKSRVILSFDCNDGDDED